MYTGYGFREFEIGDVDVLRHEGLYHLFHLTLPNHDFIAHAVSKDGLHWRRVKNALFISDPLNWDDDMLWTMHISPNPHQPEAWRMFYTGLCMRERGRIQRVGLAHSQDLYDWEKDDSGEFPLEIPAEHQYEHSLEEGRHWVSFRDPFCFSEDGDMYLVAAARVNHGPVIRRGCVALAREVGENRFQFLPPLFHPMRYDDIEVPSVVKIKNRYYLIGSIREDVKVHYWHAEQCQGPYHNFSDNVLMPQGNYAARVSQEEDGRFLIWNFFFKGLSVKGEHLMAPPKELVLNERGELKMKSYWGFDNLVIESLRPPEMAPLEPIFNNPKASGRTETTSCWMESESGFEAFLLQGEYQDFILTGKINVEGEGKLGLVMRLDENGDGYFISLDIYKGIAQIRAWGENQGGGFEEAYYYNQLQAAHYVPHGGLHPFRLVTNEQYIEFSLDGQVLLTLADDRFEKGRVGFYVESARMWVDELQMRRCEAGERESYPDSLANY
jgi:beta-fructofuranosidase